MLAQLALAATLVGGSGYNIESGEHSTVIPGYSEPPEVTIYNIESGSTTVIELEQTDKETTNEQRYNETHQGIDRQW